MSIPVNADIETLKLTLWISASLITILLATVSFFLVKQIRVQETLTSAVNQLTIAVTVIQKQQEDREPRTENRLNELDRIVDEHSKMITRIDTRCFYYHKKFKES